MRKEDFIEIEEEVIARSCKGCYFYSDYWGAFDKPCHKCSRFCRTDKDKYDLYVTETVYKILTGQEEKINLYE